QDYETAARAREKENKLRTDREQREREWKGQEMDLVAEVGEEEIAEVLALWTGIPVYKLTEEETAKLLRMEDELHKRISSQHDAIRTVSQAIRRTRAGVKDQERPSVAVICHGT